MLVRSTVSVGKTVPRTLVSVTTRRTMYDSGGDGGFNNFAKREQAKENYFIRKLEKEQMAKIRKEIQRHKDELKSLESKIDEISKRHNGKDDQK
ncbi:ATPase-binding protein KNAG_0C04090 [Huiozyma naganishii CBS 8797]|uniref:ATPase inhibitor, mitochondrial n=1 Tax=Huiozyma naganishii (strain ATCC MYA-139 / BCRC 22969 / CBS 8797 / KCTC 17520 / NBRC 10181 / NCYC 3082 / Yp74L-3) TaxID=1071383 RepID=J7RWW9_HUIN7|nr:hypothetical protein KNAG_0C04090 [Kazachstania naganishii CBS 8797]CCK69512.1 hypothetical protein KNAG_0C04090 [Kazachstania naganishii CBS 8797]